MSPIASFRSLLLASALALPTFIAQSAKAEPAGPVSAVREIEVVVDGGYNPALAARAFGHYSAACRTCHGAPGVKPDPWMVIYPAAPDLTKAEVVGAWSDEELFWVLKHGVKDTGMMALGPTHQDKDIWAVTAFVRQLPSMPAERYTELAAEQRAKQHGHDHAHH
jgi:mono/diheme cytochrome c family protein